MVLVMSTALVEEFAHEWLGMATLALFAVHQVLNWRWWRGLLRGRWTLRRVVTIAVNVGMLACMLLMLVSSLVLSRHVLAWIPALPGASWARLAHHVASYWLFVLAAFHLGMHAPPHLGRMARTVWVAAAVAGVWAFVQLGIVDYLTLRAAFSFADTSIPFAVTAVQYVLVGALAAGIGRVAWWLCALLGSWRTPRG